MSDFIAALEARLQSAERDVERARVNLYGAAGNQVQYHNAHASFNHANGRLVELQGAVRLARQFQVELDLD